MCCAAQQAGEPGLDSTPQQSLQPGQAQLLPDGSCLSPGAMRAQNQEPSRQSLEAERAMDTYLAAVRLLLLVLHLRPKANPFVLWGAGSAAAAVSMLHASVHAPVHVRLLLDVCVQLCRT